MKGKKITIIGGSGGLGRIFTRFFKKHGFDVTLMARNEERLKKVSQEVGVKYELNLQKSVSNADIVMVSIPIRSTPEMIEKVAPYLKENALIFDITSLKYEVVKSLRKVQERYPINCISLHPMFGPGIEDLKNFVMLYLKIGGTDLYESITNELFSLFKKEGLKITETTLDFHDMMIALTLGVPHMFNILFLNLIKESNQPLDELMKYTGTTFLLQKLFAENIIQKEVEMLGEIQMDNLQFQKILELFEHLLKSYRKTIKTKDMEGFKKLFSNGIEYSKNDKHYNNAYKYFYQFIKILKNDDFK